MSHVIHEQANSDRSNRSRGSMTKAKVNSILNLKINVDSDKEEEEEDIEINTPPNTA